MAKKAKQGTPIKVASQRNPDKWSWYERVCLGEGKTFRSIAIIHAPASARFPASERIQFARYSPRARSEDRLVKYTVPVDDIDWLCEVLPALRDARKKRIARQKTDTKPTSVADALAVLANAGVDVDALRDALEQGA